MIATAQFYTLLRLEEILRMKSRAIFLNEKVKKLCMDMNAKFLNLWEHISDEETFLYNYDGIH